MFATDSIPLVFAAADFWQVVIGVIFFVLYGIGQLLSASEKVKKKPAERKRPRPRLEPARKAPAGEALAPQPVGQEEALRREVDDFLRRAQGKPPRQEKPTRPPAKPQPQQLAPVLTVADPRREGVAEHVAKHLSSQQMVEHAERLGDEVAMADDRLESRLHEKFDHRLGSLKPQQKTAEKQPQKVNIAAEVAAMLQTPEGMRQLIVAQEILRRPEW